MSQLWKAVPMVSSNHNRHSMVAALRAGLITIVAVVLIATLLTSATTSSDAAPAPPTPTASATPRISCTSTIDWLSKIALEKKIGQMTQGIKKELTTA